MVKGDSPEIHRHPNESPRRQLSLGSRAGFNGDCAGMPSPELLHFLTACFVLGPGSIHGPAHWRRVCENGARLAPLTGADPEVVKYFAFLHDVQRRNEGDDPGHGLRAAHLIDQLAPAYLPLHDEQLAQLKEACAYHTSGLTVGKITILTCWDADRLDLGRVGIRPRAKCLCTQAARDPDMIAWAFARSQAGLTPE